MAIFDDTLTDIVIVNFNTRNYLADCVQSIIEHTKANTYRIWVIDNASTDDSVQWIRARATVHGIFNQKNIGYGAACNQGIKAGNGEYIFLFNSDIRVTPNWLIPMIRILKSSSRIAVVGPKLVNEDSLIVGAGVVGTHLHPIIRGWGQPDLPNRYHQVTECLSIGGSCMGIKRKLLSELGFFDENFFHYFEETDYCYNARAHGYKVIYCPTSKVIHRVNGSCHDQPKLMTYYEQSKTYFYKKWKEFLTDPVIK